MKAKVTELKKEKKRLEPVVKNLTGMTAESVLKLKDAFNAKAKKLKAANKKVKELQEELNELQEKLKNKNK